MTVLTFPTNPTNGQRYAAPNGIQYVYDGVKWTVETVASTSAAVTDAVQDRVAPMFVDGDNTGITFTYNAATNVISAEVTAVNGNRLINGNKTLTLESNGNITLSNTGTISDSVEIAGTPGILISRTFQTPDNAIASNFGTNTIKILLSDVDGAQIANYIGRGIAVGAWFSVGGASFPMTSCVQVSTGIWTITATGIGNRFTTFAANPLIFIHTGVIPNTYQNFAQYALTIPAATTISKGGKNWRFAADGTTTFPTGGQIENYPGGVGVSNNSWFVTPGNNGNGGVSSQDGQQYIQINNDLFVEIGTSYGTANQSLWRFGLDGDLTLPAGGDIVDSNGDSVLGGTDSYTPDDTDNWNAPAVNTLSAALDELALRLKAVENIEIEGGNAYAIAGPELILDGNGA